jgi:ankyrin repeat protein
MDDTGKTPLHRAAILQNNCHVIQCLLEHGANMKQGDHKHWTPIHYAAWYGRLEHVATMLSYAQDHDIDINVMATTKDLTSVESQRDCPEMANSSETTTLSTTKTTLTSEMNTDKDNPYVCSPVDLAKKNHHVLVVRLLEHFHEEQHQRKQQNCQQHGCRRHHHRRHHHQQHVSRRNSNGTGSSNHKKKKAKSSSRQITSRSERISHDDSIQNEASSIIV